MGILAATMKFTLPVEIAMATQPVRIAIIAGVGALVAGAVYLWAVRGHAVILDLATGAVAFLCF